MSVPSLRTIGTHYGASCRAAFFSLEVDPLQARATCTALIPSWILCHALFMIILAAQDSKSAVELFQEENSGQLVWEGHPGER